MTPILSWCRRWPPEDDTRAALPLLTLAPIVAALSVAFLHHPQADPAWEVVAATPTSPAAPLFARLTLILCAPRYLRDSNWPTRIGLGVAVLMETDNLSTADEFLVTLVDSGRE